MGAKGGKQTGCELTYDAIETLLKGVEVESPAGLQLH